MTNIFISYSRKAEAITKALAEDLEALGHTVWFDQELSGGQAWWNQILEMVRRCELFVFVLTPEALNSTACKREYGYALELGKHILPVLASDRVNLNLLPPALSQIQFVDYKQQDRGAALRLARAVSTVPPPQALPDPLPPPPEAPISYLGRLTEQVETAAVLTYEQQSALAVDLKRSLRDPAHANDARHLLGKLRRRRDLFAAIAEEIDEALGSVRKESAPPPASEVPPPRPERSQRKEAPSIPAEGGPPEKREPHHPGAQPARITADQKTSGRQRLTGAGLLTILGAAGGFLAWDVQGMGSGYMNPVWYLFPLGGTVAGNLSGMNRSRIIAALIGMGVAVVLASSVRYYFSSLAMVILALVLPPLGVLVSLYITKRKA